MTRFRRQVVPRRIAPSLPRDTDVLDFWTIFESTGYKLETDDKGCMHIRQAHTTAPTTPRSLYLPLIDGHATPIRLDKTTMTIFKEIGGPANEKRTFEQVCRHTFAPPSIVALLAKPKYGVTIFPLAWNPAIAAHFSNLYRVRTATASRPKQKRKPSKTSPPVAKPRPIGAIASSIQGVYPAGQIRLPTGPAMLSAVGGRY